MCVLEACEACKLVLACSGSVSDTHQVCDYGFSPPDGVNLCRQKPGACAVAGERTNFVPAGQYSHNCQPIKRQEAANGKIAYPR